MKTSELNEKRANIGRLLKAKREHKNLTISQLSRKSKLSRHTIYAIESASKSFDFNSYVLYLDALGLSDSIIA